MVTWLTMKRNLNILHFKKSALGQTFFYLTPNTTVVLGVIINFPLLILILLFLNGVVPAFSESAKMSKFPLNSESFNSNVSKEPLWTTTYLSYGALSIPCP